MPYTVDWRDPEAGTALPREVTVAEAVEICERWGISCVLYEADTGARAGVVDERGWHPG